MQGSSLSLYKDILALIAQCGCIAVCVNKNNHYYIEWRAYYVFVLLNLETEYFHWYSVKPLQLERGTELERSDS